MTAVVSALPLPSVAIEGPSSLSATPQGSIEIVARSNSTCSGSMPVSFSWSVVKQSLQGALPSLTSNIRSIRFVPSAQGMFTGVSYTFEVKATISVGGTNLSATATAVVIIQPSKIVMKANLGNRAISSSQDIVLDVSSSYDPDLAAGSASGIAFGWSCNPIVADPRSSSGFAPVSTPCFDNQIAILGATTDKLAVLGEDAALASSSRATLVPGTYQFSVTGAKTGLTASQPRLGTVVMVIEVVKRNVQLAPPYDVSIGLVPAVVSPSLPLSFRYNGPTLTGQFFPTWAFRGIGSDINLESAAVIESMPRTSFLVIKPNILTPGQSYVLRLSVSAPGRETGWSEVAFYVSPPPSGGTCAISPLSGFAVNTTFTLSCSSWSTDPSLSPLKYQWLYYDETVTTSSGFPLMSIVAMTPKSTSMVQLPVSNRFNAAGLRIVARIIDSSGTKAELLMPDRVQVQALPASVTSSSAFLSNAVVAISNIAASGDANIVFGALNALLSMDTPGKPSLFDFKWNAVSTVPGGFRAAATEWQQQERMGARETTSAPSASAATQKALTSSVFNLANSNSASSDLASKLADTVAKLVNFNPSIDDDSVIAQLYGILKQSKKMMDSTQSISGDYISTLARAVSFFKNFR